MWLARKTGGRCRRLLQAIGAAQGRAQHAMPAVGHARCRTCQLLQQLVAQHSMLHVGVWECVVWLARRKRGMLRTFLPAVDAVEGRA